MYNKTTKANKQRNHRKRELIRNENKYEINRLAMFNNNTNIQIIK